MRKGAIVSHPSSLVPRPSHGGFQPRDPAGDGGVQLAMLTLEPAAAALNGRVGRELNGGASARVMGEEIAADHLHVFRVQVDRDGRCRMDMVERLPDEGERPLRLEAELLIEELLSSLRGERRQLRGLFEAEAT